MEGNKKQEQDDFINDFIRVGELRKMMEHLSDDDFITVCDTRQYPSNYHRILYVEDSTAVGFWEIRI